MTLFTHLKIILLQYFQFSTINGIQTDPKPKILVPKTCGHFILEIRKKKKEKKLILEMGEIKEAKI